MKTNMLIFSLMISAAAAAQTSIQANSSSKSELTVKKNQAKLSSQSSNSQETSVKNNKISGETSLQQQAELNRGAQAQNADYHDGARIKSKAGEGVSATEKEKSALTASTSKMATKKQGESKEMANDGVRTSEKLNGSVQSRTKAGVQATEKMNASVQSNAKADVKAGVAKTAPIQKSAKATVSSAHSARVQNISAVKAGVRPKPVKVNTQIKSVTAVRIR